MALTDEELEYLLSHPSNHGEEKPIWNYEQTIYGVTISLLVATISCVLLRFYVRWKGNFIGWDDSWLVLTVTCVVEYSVSICLSVQDGFGQHTTEADLIHFQQKFYGALIGYTLSTTFIKLCLLQQYLRLFKKGTRTRLVILYGIVIVALWGSAFSFIAIFPCFPVYGFFDWTYEATCYGFGSKNPPALMGTFVAHAATNAALDIFVLVLPGRLYIKRNKPWKQRMGLYGLILLGLGVVIVSIKRIEALVEHRATTYPVMDPCWYGPEMILLAVIEVDLAAVAASAPVFWPLLQEQIGRIFVTQEVEVTHQRLSGEDDGHEMQSSDDTLTGSSLQSIRTPEKAHTHATALPTGAQYVQQYGKPKGIPTGLEIGPSEATSASKVSSGGSKGFKREQERMGLGTQPKSNNPFHQHHHHIFDHMRSPSRQRSDSSEVLRGKDSSDERLGSLSGRTFFYEEMDGNRGQGFQKPSRSNSGEVTSAGGPMGVWPASSLGSGGKVHGSTLISPRGTRPPERDDPAFFL